MAGSISALLLTEDGNVYGLELAPDDPDASEPTYVRDLQMAVGGHFEHIALQRDDADMWVHEMGAYLLPPNPLASLACALFGGLGGMRIFGPVVVTGGCDSSGTTLGLDPDVAAALRDYSAIFTPTVVDTTAQTIHEWAVAKIGRPATAPKKWEA